MRRAGWISTIRASCTRCWWTCAPGWLPRRPRTGSSTRCWRWPRRPGWSAASGCWTRQRCMTRWPRWTRSRWSARLSGALAQAAALLATVLGQDLDQDEAGGFRIARRVAKDRVISTVDPDTRHGHKTSARGFDGYKGHVGIDPDTEIITATTVTAGK